MMRSQEDVSEVLVDLAGEAANKRDWGGVELLARCALYISPELHTAEEFLRAANAARSVDGEWIKLHEEIEAILRESGNQGMTTRELAAAVNRRHRYRKANGTLVKTNQIHARISHKRYMDAFKIVNGKVFLTVPPLKYRREREREALRLTRPDLHL